MMAQSLRVGMMPLLLAFAPCGGSLAAQASQPSLLGKWHGTSICTKAAWNAACNDEEAFYNFVRVPGGASKVLLHAYKRVGTAIEPMGDMEFVPDTGRGRWTSEFSNSRVHIRWNFQVADSVINGTLLMLPSMQVARTVRVRRDSAWQEPH